MNERLKNPVAWIAFALFSVCAISQAAAADIRGKITQISTLDRKDPFAIVRIEGAKEADTSYDKASVRVMLQTRLMKIEAGKRVAAEWGDFKMGQTVEATFAGPVAESYPVQAAASEIVLLAQAAEKAEADNPARALKEGEEVTLTGVLRGGGMAIGGETTGWMFSYKTAQGMRHVEVDIGKLDVKKVVGKSVRITAKVVNRNYVERGRTLILNAATIEPANP